MGQGAGCACAENTHKKQRLNKTMNTEQTKSKPRDLATILVDPEKSFTLRLFLASRPGTEEHADFWTQAVEAGLRKPLDGIGISPEFP